MRLIRSYRLVKKILKENELPLCESLLYETKKERQRKASRSPWSLRLRREEAKQEKAEERITLEKKCKNLD
ncbi:MAG: hypothetical protein ICV85_13965 [Tolypothrix sp. T3-bin4]|nr:hypothetical protein [Tolypothrix sp. Co-bin9]MBD0303227.1 hypothetical protein [Tolypothrix sp. T3-bin4]